MLYVDIPTRSEIAVLTEVIQQGCVSIYLSTTPVTQNIGAAQIALGNAIRETDEKLQALEIEKRQRQALLQALESLKEDEVFWRYQSNSLAIFATPEHIYTFRLPNELTPMVMVTDRFHLKPLYRALTFAHSAFILALSENDARLLEMYSDGPSMELAVDDMPDDAASAAGVSTLNDRSPSGRLQGSEGKNLRLEQYARKVDAALRSVLAGRETPLILAATGRVAKVFVQLNSYPHLLAQTIQDSPDRMTPAQLAELARPILDAHYAQELSDLRALFNQRESEGRTTTDIAHAARAATQGAIQTLMVDMDTVVHGTVDDVTGAVTMLEAGDVAAYGVVDEITARALRSGARVLAVRRADIPNEQELAAILRYAM